jgi:hypothetical protein
LMDFCGGVRSGPAERSVPPRVLHISPFGQRGGVDGPAEAVEDAGGVVALAGVFADGFRGEVGFVVAGEGR